MACCQSKPRSKSSSPPRVASGDTPHSVHHAHRHGDMTSTPGRRSVPGGASPGRTPSRPRPASRSQSPQPYQDPTESFMAKTGRHVYVTPPQTKAAIAPGGGSAGSRKPTPWLPTKTSPDFPELTPVAAESVSRDLLAAKAVGRRSSLASHSGNVSCPDLDRMSDRSSVRGHGVADIEDDEIDSIVKEYMRFSTEKSRGRQDAVRLAGTAAVVFPLTQ